MMTLDELLRALGAQTQDRNGVVNADTYTPSSTTFSPYDNAPGDLSGYVAPFRDSSVAHLGINNDDDINQLYTAFHEAAHTAQPALSDIGGEIGIGPYAPLSKNKFDGYSSKTGVPPAHEALATLRGTEAMMPPGTTIWSLLTDSNPDHAGSRKDVEQYLNETLRNNPQMTRQGAMRLIDTQMFPDKSLMHESSDFQTGPRSLADLLRRYIR